MAGGAAARRVGGGDGGEYSDFGSPVLSDEALTADELTQVDALLAKADGAPTSSAWRRRRIKFESTDDQPRFAGPQHWSPK